MAKGVLKEHLILNAAKLKNYGSVRDEIQCYLENKQNAEPYQMDMNVITKGAGKVAKNYRESRACRNCGKRGHWARDCWGPGGAAAAKGSSGKAGKSKVELRWKLPILWKVLA